VGCVNVNLRLDEERDTIEGEAKKFAADFIMGMSRRVVLFVQPEQVVKWGQEIEEMEEADGGEEEVVVGADRGEVGCSRSRRRTAARSMVSPEVMSDFAGQRRSTHRVSQLEYSYNPVDNIPPSKPTTHVL